MRRKRTSKNPIESVQRKLRRNGKFLLIIAVISLLLVTISMYASVGGDLFSGLLAMQGRYYVPKDSDRERLIQEEGGSNRVSNKDTY